MCKSPSGNPTFVSDLHVVRAQPIASTITYEYPPLDRGLVSPFPVGTLEGAAVLSGVSAHPRPRPDFRQYPRSS